MNSLEKKNMHTLLVARLPRVLLLVLGDLQHIGSLVSMHQLPGRDILHSNRGHLEHNLCTVQPGGPLKLIALLQLPLLVYN